MALAFDTHPLRVVLVGACGGVGFETPLQREGCPHQCLGLTSASFLSCLPSPKSQLEQVQVRVLVQVQVQVQELVLVLVQVLVLVLVLVAHVELVLSSLPALALSLSFVASFSPSLLPCPCAASLSHTPSTVSARSSTQPVPWPHWPSGTIF